MEAISWILHEIEVSSYVAQAAAQWVIALAHVVCALAAVAIAIGVWMIATHLRKSG